MFKHKCERKLTGQHNHCSACGEYFNSNAAFEKHRIGEFGIDRRCATVEEMTVKGMAKNAGDWWVTAAMPDSRSYSDRNKPVYEVGSAWTPSGALTPVID